MNLKDQAIQCIMRGYEKGWRQETPPNQQIARAEQDVNMTTPMELLELISNALDELIPPEPEIDRDLENDLASTAYGGHWGQD